MTTSVIVAGARTPVGKLMGSLKDFSGSDLGAIARLATPGQGGAQVVMLALQAYQPLVLPRTTELGLGGLREPQIVLRVSPARSLGLAARIESLSAILPQRLQDLVAERPLGRRLGQHEGLADQAR